VADLRPQAGPRADELRRVGVPVFAGHTVVQAKGGKSVTEATIAPVSGGDEHSFGCDLVVVSGGTIPSTSLLLQAGARSAYDQDRGHFALQNELPESLYAAGEVAGAETTDAAAMSGELAGREAAHALGHDSDESRARATELHAELSGAQRPEVTVAPPVSGAGRGKCFACLCEDVTSKDVHLSIEEGYDSIELSKRYTTVTMGPCQGRMCQLPSVRLMAQETGQSLAQVGTTTARPPWVSVPMGILGGRPVEPAKRSAVHDRHRTLG